LGEVLYAVRIDPLARLEKLKAAAAALQVAESREMPGWKVEAVCSGLDGRPPHNQDHYANRPQLPEPRAVVRFGVRDCEG
jgi:hypothetical protein